GLPSAAHRMLASTHKQTRRLDKPVCNVYFDPVDDGFAVYGFQPFTLGLFGKRNFLLLFLWQTLVPFLLLFLHLLFFICQAVSHRKINVFDRDVLEFFRQELSEVDHEILLENRILHIMCVLFLCPCIHKLFLIAINRQLFTSDRYHDPSWLVLRRECDSLVLQRLPLSTYSSRGRSDGLFQFYKKTVEDYS